MWILLPVFALAAMTVFSLLNGKSRLAKWLLILSCIFLAGVMLTASMAETQLISVGCKGFARNGMICPDQSLMTRAATVHQTLYLLSILYCAIGLPVVLGVCAVAEFFARRKATASRQMP